MQPIKFSNRQSYFAGTQREGMYGFHELSRPYLPDFECTSDPLVMGERSVRFQYRAGSGAMWMAVIAALSQKAEHSERGISLKMTGACRPFPLEDGNQ